MKKILAIILASALSLSMLGACAEAADPLFGQLSRLEWSFSSGAGAWSTELRIGEDGSFSGEYHDSEMGECAEAYPDGTVYCCSFTGRFSLAERISDNSWRLRVEALQPDADQAEESVEDGIRYVKAAPYGLSEGDEMLLFEPGTPLTALPEALVFWTHVQEQEDAPEALESWFLCSAANESGFVGFASEPLIGLPNPWVDLTAEQLKEASGLSFRLPEGAKDIVYRYLPAEQLAEGQYTWEDGEFCVRTQPAVLAADEALPELSGMYFAWEDEEAVTIRGCRGVIGQAKCGSEDWVQRCLWYDDSAGRLCSLSVSTTDPDGLDLCAIAEDIL